MDEKSSEDSKTKEKGKRKEERVTFVANLSPICRLHDLFINVEVCDRNKVSNVNALNERQKIPKCMPIMTDKTTQD